MSSLAKWRPGRIVEPWQRRIVERDKQMAIDTINGLMTVVYGGLPPAVGPVDFEAQCDRLTQLSASDIIGQLRLYWRTTNMALTKADEGGIGTLDIAVTEGQPVNISGKRITSDGGATGKD